MSCKNLPLSNMAECYKRETWALGTSTLISVGGSSFYGKGSFLRRRLTSTEGADFYEEADCYGGS